MLTLARSRGLKLGLSINCQPFSPVVMAVDQLVAPPPIAGSTRPAQNKIGFCSQMWRHVGAKTAAGWPEVALHGIGGRGSPEGWREDYRRERESRLSATYRPNQPPVCASAEKHYAIISSSHQLLKGQQSVISSEWLEAGGGQRLAPL